MRKVRYVSDDILLNYTPSYIAWITFQSSHPPFFPLSGAITDNLPSGVLYKVKASYKYQAEDVDELQFEVGEIIQVVPYEDPEEQEEGWLMGIRESNGQKGMFPANFTRPI